MIASTVVVVQKRKTCTNKNRNNPTSPGKRGCGVASTQLAQQIYKFLKEGYMYVCVCSVCVCPCSVCVVRPQQYLTSYQHHPPSSLHTMESSSSIIPCVTAGECSVPPVAPCRSNLDSASAACVCTAAMEGSCRGGMAWCCGTLPPQGVAPITIGGVWVVLFPCFIFAVAAVVFARVADSVLRSTMRSMSSNTFRVW